MSTPDKPKPWSGLITSMRVSPSAYPELHEELEKTTHRDRIRRLCSLAQTGLTHTRLAQAFASGATPGAVDIQPETTQTKHAPTKRAERNSIYDRMESSG